METLQVFVLVLICESVILVNGEDKSEECDQKQGNWPFQLKAGQNVNYMPVMAMPVLPGPKGEPGTPGSPGTPGVCDASTCKCNCENLLANYRTTTTRHARRELRRTGEGTSYQKTRPNYDYYRGPRPQNIQIPPTKGDKGDKGEMGKVGVPGPRGPPGLPGSKGEPGISGGYASRGRTIPGSKGARGVPGVRGLPGLPGIRGPAGPTGPPGRSGSLGQGKKGEPGTPGVPGKNGPAGKPGMKGELGRPGRPGLPGKPGQIRQVSGQDAGQKRVAFTAAMTKSLGPVQLATPVKFRDVILNQGSAYNLITGIFTAPYNGTYVVSYNALSQYDRAVELTLLHNAKIISSIHSRDTGGYTGVGNSIVVHLSRGDRLWVELSPGSFFLYGDTGRHTIFSGYLLYAE